MNKKNSDTIPNREEAIKQSNLELFRLLLQPHFLFNSLNNIYALSIKNSDQTPEAIASLSCLLEKIVHHSQQEKISLREEMELIKHYIKLERIWLGEASFMLDLSVSGDIDEIKLPPMILYTFVENCFKHGIRRCGSSGWITIKVDVKKKNLFFSTRNLLPNWDISTIQDENEKSGFGLVAAKELLEQKCCGQFLLNSGQEGNVYAVDLRMELED